MGFLTSIMLQNIKNKVSESQKRGKVLLYQKVERGILLLGMVLYFLLRDFGGVQYEVLSTCGKGALCTKSGTIALKNLAAEGELFFPRKRRLTSLEVCGKFLRTFFPAYDIYCCRAKHFVHTAMMVRTLYHRKTRKLFCPFQRCQN